ncbi:hypothetical protein GCM10027187_30870 [Streptosporangium sandarakinum]
MPLVQQPQRLHPPGGDGRHEFGVVAVRADRGRFAAPDPEEIHIPVYRGIRRLRFRLGGNAGPTSVTAGNVGDGG